MTEPEPVRKIKPPKVVRDNWRVEVTPALGTSGRLFLHKVENEREENNRLDCEEIAKAIKRHVDKVERVDVVYDSHKLCPCCGEPYEPEPDEDGKFPCCEGEAYE